MVDNKRYKRYFIILENEDPGFGKEDKNIPKGYAKIEVRNGKGILNVYVQDLKYFEDGKYIYRNYLISTKAKIYVDTGSLMIDDKGKGELKCKLDPNNIEGTGKDIEEFDVVAIVAEPLEKGARDEDIVAPLAGYMDKKRVEWKSVLKNKGHMKSKEDEYKKEEPKTQEIIDEEDELDEEYKEKYEKIMKTIEEGAKEFYGQKVEESKVHEEKDLEESKIEENKETENKKIENEEIEKEEIEDKVENIEKVEKCKKVIEEFEESIGDYKKVDKYDVGKYEKYEKIEEVEEIKEENEKIDKEVEEVSENEEIKGTEEYEEKFIESYYKQENKYGPYMKGNNYKSENPHNKQHKKVYKHVRDILKYYESVRPFERNIGNCKWWKIPYNKENIYKNFIPFFGHIFNMYYYNPYISYMNNCNDLMYKYGHYIFGICYDIDNEPKYYVYGVPGRYMYKEQPFRGITGFVYWHPLEDKEPQKGDYGYWLLHIDAKTGKVVFPLRPTIPPMY